MTRPAGTFGSSSARVERLSARPCPGPEAAHPVNASGHREAPLTSDPLCETCRRWVRWALRDLPELYVQAWMAHAPSRHPGGPKVSGSHEAPMPIDAGPSLLMAEIVQVLGSWADAVRTAASLAAPRPARRRLRRVSAVVEVVEPAIVEREDGGHDVRELVTRLASTTVLGHAADRVDGHYVSTDAALLAAHLDTWLALPATTVGRSVSLSELATLPDDTLGSVMAGGAHVFLDLTGVQGALEVLDLKRRARRELGRTRGKSRLPEPCPNPACEVKALVRWDGADQVECEACGETWPERDYERLVKVLADYRGATRRKGSRA